MSGKSPSQRGAMRRGGLALAFLLVGLAGGPAVVVPDVAASANPRAQRPTSLWQAFPIGEPPSPRASTSPDGHRRVVPRATALPERLGGVAPLPAAVARGASGRPEVQLPPATAAGGGTGDSNLFERSLVIAGCLIGVVVVVVFSRQFAVAGSRGGGLPFLRGRLPRGRRSSSAPAGRRLSSLGAWASRTVAVARTLVWQGSRLRLSPVARILFASRVAYRQGRLGDVVSFGVAVLFAAAIGWFIGHAYS